jgi:hypothetical protein
MRSILHNLILVPAVVAAAALAITSANAETTLKIPFGFTVAGKYCPAGRYAVEQDTTGNFVRLIGKDSSKSFNWLVGPGSPDPTANKVVLKFDESGQTHALRSIQFGSMITSRLDTKTMETESGQRSEGR